MKEVAKLAGVSTSTVSKVINGKDKDISEKTRKKVLEIVESSNYVPYLKYLEKDNLKNAMIGLIIRRNHRERCPDSFAVCPIWSRRRGRLRAAFLWAVTPRAGIWLSMRPCTVNRRCGSG